MAHNQNSSFFNHFSSAYGDRTIRNGQFLSLHSNFNENYVYGSGLLNSELSLFNPTTNTVGFQHQNGYLFQNTHLDLTGFGQQRFYQSITEVRQRTLIASSRLQNANFVDYGFHLQNRPALAPNNIIQFSGVVRNTQFLSSTSTMDRLLSQGNSTLQYHRHSKFGNPRFHALNQYNRPPTENTSFLAKPCPHNHNNSIVRQTSTTIDLEKSIDHHMHPPPINSVSASQVQGENLSLAPPNPSPNLNPTFDLQDIKIHQNFYIGESSRNPVSISNASNNPTTSQTNNNDSNKAVEYDGVIHSLRSKKHGYICPKCKEDLSSSQKFASHVKSHYRNESPAERRKRLAAKIKKKMKKSNKFRLVNSSDGLTVVPSKD